MSLSTRTRLGPYEILAPLAAGGMGELYRARDTRLGRDVAIKIIDPRYAADPVRLKRFEREARLASSLNHSNIITVHDVGVSDSVCYIAMELVEGTSLRAMLRRGPLPVRQLLDVAVQMADGLAAAHGSGVVHRDLKPDNVMVRTDGSVKLLDFGLAKLGEDDPAAGEALTMSSVSRPGVVLGTPGYMSPEQVSGDAVDFRSDQFAFGSILYEMATGRTPFTGRTPAAAMLAILRDEPDDVGSLNPKVPAPLRWLIQRCLSKDPRGRYAATEDLARELRTIREHLADAPAAVAASPARHVRGGWGRALLVVAALVAGVIVGAFLPRRAASPPSFHPLTFGRGDVSAARFAPDGRSFVYAFSGSGLPGDIYYAPFDGSSFRPLGLNGAQLFSISRSGELAIALRWRWVGPYSGFGTLARVPLEGGSPRPVADNVALADWTPDGKDLVMVRRVDGAYQVEFPAGRRLHRTRGVGSINEMRMSPRGDLIAIAEVDGPNGRYSVVTVDPQGNSRILSTEWRRVEGLAWTPDGRELWFAGTRTNFTEINVLYAVSRSGKERVVGNFPGSVSVNDIGTDGRVLLTQARVRREMTGLLAGDTTERDLSWLDYSFPTDLSADGTRLLFLESGKGATSGPTLWLKTVDTPVPVSLGEGEGGSSLSPDGKWAAVVGSASKPGGTLKLIPVGAGQERAIDLGGLFTQWTRWLPNGEGLIVAGAVPGGRLRSYFVGVRGGPPRPITPEGVFASLVTPDARWLLADWKGLPVMFSVASGEPRPLATPANEAGLREAANDFDPIGWGDNDHTVYVARAGVPAEILLLDLQTGKTTPWKRVAPADCAGVRIVTPVAVARGGRAYVATFRRVLSDVYLVDGLK